MEGGHETNFIIVGGGIAAVTCAETVCIAIY